MQISIITDAQVDNSMAPSMMTKQK